MDSQDEALESEGRDSEGQDSEVWDKKYEGQDNEGQDNESQEVGNYSIQGDYQDNEGRKHPDGGRHSTGERDQEGALGGSHEEFQREGQDNDWQFRYCNHLRAQGKHRRRREEG